MTTQNNPHKFIIGQRVRDRVTGFEGVTISRIEYLNGCVQYCVKPEVDPKKPGTFPEGAYIDDAQLELVDEGILAPPPMVEQFVEPGTVGGRVARGGPSHREGELPR